LVIKAEVTTTRTVLPLSCGDDEWHGTNEKSWELTSFQAEACIESDVNQLMFVKVMEIEQRKDAPFIGEGIWQKDM
jgi:hypothetical protein